MSSEKEKHVSTSSSSASTTVPNFKTLDASRTTGFVEERQVYVPSNRRTPFQENYIEIIKPIVEKLKLQLKYEKGKNIVRLRPGPSAEASALQKV